MQDQVKRTQLILQKNRERSASRASQQKRWETIQPQQNMLHPALSSIQQQQLSSIQHEPQLREQPGMPGSDVGSLERKRLGSHWSSAIYQKVGASKKTIESTFRDMRHEFSEASLIQKHNQGIYQNRVVSEQAASSNMISNRPISESTTHRPEV